MQIGPGKEKLFLEIWHFNLTVTQFQGFLLLTEYVLGCEFWRNPYWQIVDCHLLAVSHSLKWAIR